MANISLLLVPLDNTAIKVLTLLNSSLLSNLNMGPARMPCRKWMIKSSPGNIGTVGLSWGSPDNFGQFAVLASPDEEVRDSGNLQPSESLVNLWAKMSDATGVDSFVVSVEY